MSVSLIGLLFAGAGGVSVFWSRIAAFQVLCIATLFGAASAIVMGPANITPGHFALGFFLVAVAIRNGGLVEFFRQMAPSGAGYFLLLATIWAVFTAFAMPRIFHGQIYVIPVSSETVYVAQPLGSSSTNITQSVYIIGNLIAFCAAAAFVQSRKNMRAAGFALVVTTLMNIGLAVLDSVTYAAGMSHIMDFMRNADYAQAYGAVVMGMKRMTGSFPEASSFVTYSVVLFAFSLRLWRGGVFPSVTGYAAFGLLFAIMLAFSSTGYLAVGLYLICVYVMDLIGIDSSRRPRGRVQSQRQIFIAMGPVGLFALGVIIAIRPELLEPVTSMFDESITNKLSSDSGVERMAWNMGGLRNFVESFGLGVGLGSVRVSSYIVALPANVGVIGTLLMGTFFFRLFFPSIGSVQRINTEYEEIQAAARSACLAGLLASCIVATTMDFGLLVAVCAGIACARPRLDERLAGGEIGAGEAAFSSTNTALAQRRQFG